MFSYYEETNYDVFINFLAVTLTVIGSVGAYAAANRLLAIYCVETDKKQIAISFDAAWGNSKKIQNIAKAHNY